MRRVIVVLIIAASLGRFGVAAAKIDCGEHPVVIAPAGGAVGPEPTLYVFRLHPRFLKVLYHGEPAPIRIEDADGAVPFTAVDRSATEDVQVIELRVHRRRGAITVYWNWNGERKPAHYTLDQPVSPAWPPRVTDLYAHDGAESCRGYCCVATLGVDVSIDAPGAIAFRIAWRDGTSSIVPHNRSTFDSDRPERRDVRVLIGSSTCEGQRIPAGRDVRQVAAIEALYVDGTAQLVRGPLVIAKPRSRRPIALDLGVALAVVALVALGACRRRRRVSASVPG